MNIELVEPWTKFQTAVHSRIEKLRGIPACAFAAAVHAFLRRTLARVLVAVDTQFAQLVELPAELRQPMILGSSVVLFGFFGFTTWAALAPIKSAVVAPGVVAVESKRRVIQHLEGGIVAEIAAHDGQLVKEGDLLLRIDDTQ